MYGILFDFNGTMFFDETLQRQSWECFLSERLGRAVADDEFQEYVRGRNAEETFRHFFGREFSREEVAALEEEKERVYRALCLQSAAFCLADGLPRLLDELASREVPVNIATASGKQRGFFLPASEAARMVCAGAGGVQRRHGPRKTRPGHLSQSGAESGHGCKGLHRI